MTTLAAKRFRSAWTPPVWQLGGVEARRMLRHPAYPIVLVCLAAFAVSAIVDHEAGPPGNFVYQVLYTALSMVYAPMTLVVANRVAAATFRRRVRQTFDAAPVDGRQRTVAAIIGLIRGPVLVGLAGAGALLALGPFTPAINVPLDWVTHPRTALEYLQLPVLVLGAGLLGIAVARWLPLPGALPLTALVLWCGTVAMFTSQPTNTDLVHDGTWFALWPVWTDTEQGMLPRQPLDRGMWHLTYLLGLSLLAGIAALLKTDGPRRALWTAAGIIAAVTTVAARLQLGS